MASATPKSADDALWISEAVGFVAGASLKQLKLLEGAIASRRDELESGVATAEGEVTAGADSEDPAAEIVAEAIATGNFNKLDIVNLARQPVTAADVAGKSEIRLLLNGCFDIMHAGHYNALRQAKGLFAGFRVPVLLVAGIHRTESIIEQKGPPVMTMEERIAMVEACKWVDEVAVIPEYLINNAVLDLLNCDFCAHGDDIPIRTDGTGMYHEVIAANRFRMIKRTEGVSTTTFIGRLLQAVGPTAGVVASDADEGAAPVAVSATLLPTGSRITTFADGMRPIGEAKRVVYVDGTFDCLHVGHIEFLKRARAQGDYLLVGLHSDAVATATHGPGNPIMALHERALC